MPSIFDTLELDSPGFPCPDCDGVARARYRGQPPACPTCRDWGFLRHDPRTTDQDQE